MGVREHGAAVERERTGADAGRPDQREAAVLERDPGARQLLCLDAGGAQPDPVRCRPRRNEAAARDAGGRGEDPQAALPSGQRSRATLDRDRVDARAGRRTARRLHDGPGGRSEDRDRQIERPVSTYGPRERLEPLERPAVAPSEREPLRPESADPGEASPGTGRLDGAGPHVARRPAQIGARVGDPHRTEPQVVRAHAAHQRERRRPARAADRRADGAGERRQCGQVQVFERRRMCGRGDREPASVDPERALAAVAGEVERAERRAAGLLDERERAERAAAVLVERKWRGQPIGAACLDEPLRAEARVRPGKDSRRRDARTRHQLRRVGERSRRPARKRHDGRLRRPAKIDRAVRARGDGAVVRRERYDVERLPVIPNRAGRLVDDDAAVRRSIDAEARQDERVAHGVLDQRVQRHGARHGECRRERGERAQTLERAARLRADPQLRLRQVVERAGNTQGQTGEAAVDLRQGNAAVEEARGSVQVEQRQAQCRQREGGAGDVRAAEQMIRRARAQRVQPNRDRTRGAGAHRGDVAIDEVVDDRGERERLRAHDVQRIGARRVERAGRDDRIGARRDAIGAADAVAGARRGVDLCVDLDAVDALAARDGMKPVRVEQHSHAIGYPHAQLERRARRRRRGRLGVAADVYLGRIRDV